MDPHRKAWTFGQPDDFISIWPADLAYFNVVLQEVPRLATVIELGTYLGGSAFMWASAMMLRPLGRVVTFDNGPVPNRLGFPDCCEFVRADVMTPETVEAIARLIGPAPFPVLMFCDNGEKPKEVALYGPLLRPGDVLAVHDWYEEHDPADQTVITPANAPPWVFNAALWEPVRPDCWWPNMHARAWRRTEAPWP